MSNSEFQNQNFKVQILGLIGVLVLLGAVAWGVGWVAHDWSDRRNAPPQPTAGPTIRPIMTSTSTAMPTSPPASTTSVPTADPTSSPAPALTETPKPTVTPVPTFAPTPTEAWEIVLQDEGLYQVCRRHCPGIWPNNRVPPSLTEYAREVARINGLSQPSANGPRLDQGARLKMPPCP